MPRPCAEPSVKPLAVGQIILSIKYFAGAWVVKALPNWKAGTDYSDFQHTLRGTAGGPDDPAIGVLNAAVETSGATAAAVNDRIGAGLGQTLDSILETARLQRTVVAGGDTSGHALQAMGIYALTAIVPLTEGAPLCRASSDRTHATIEIALKGGHVGGVGLFCRARDGG